MDHFARLAWLWMILLAFGVGCAGAPISMKVQAGSTILIPLQGDDFTLSPGFGSEITQTYQDFDDQRGELVFYLRDPAAMVDYRLKTRYVTRVYADPATNTPYAGEILALADIPLPSDPTYPGPFVSSDKEFKVIVKRRQRNVPGSPPTYGAEVDYFAGYPPGTPDLRVTVTPGTGAPNPFEGWDGSFVGSGETVAGLYARVPPPQLVIQVGSGGGGPGWEKPGAIQFDLSYPNAKLSIKGVGEWGTAGRYSVVRYRQVSADLIRVWLVDPDESVAAIGVAFQLNAPGTQGKTATTDFSISGVKLYHKNGSSYTSGTYPVFVGFR